VETPTIERRQRLVLGVVMVGILAFALVALQRQFDSGDDRRARELLASHPPGAKWWVGREMVERAGGVAPNCTTEIVSGCRGLIQVSCSAGEGAPYLFSVDLVRHAVTPLDERTQSLMDLSAKKNAE
jgi:hypothetical protein